MNIGSRQKNYLQEKEAPVTPSNLTYSAAVKKAGDVPQVFVLTNLELQLVYSAINVHRRIQVQGQELQGWAWWEESLHLPVTTFGEVMIGPVPCVLAHDILYMELREILYLKGRVVTMFLNKASHLFVKILY